MSVLHATSNVEVRAGSHHSQKPKLAHAKTSKNLKSQTEVPKIYQGRTENYISMIRFQIDPPTAR